MNSRSREELREESSGIRFDVAIIGAGINGASLYHELCGRGYRVLLLDKGDFACGTSQASAMRVWGGLLYLRNFDIKAVVEFSLSRDRMIERLDGRVRPGEAIFDIPRHIPSPDTAHILLVSPTIMPPCSAE